MASGSTLRLLLAGALALAASAAPAAPAGPRLVLPGAEPVPVQAQAKPQEVVPPPAAAPEAPPQEILPAPSMPGADPVVKLPPPSEEPAQAAQPAAPTPPTAGSTVFSFADLAARLLDEVVYISTSQKIQLPNHAPPPKSANPDPKSEDFFDDFFNHDGDNVDRRTVQSLGSGFIVDPSGLIVTNNHVIADADEIVANLADGTSLEATVVGIDDKTDLALLKVEPKTPLKAAEFGRSDKLRVGDWVLAIGNPFGFGGTVTAGIVSALDRDIKSGPYDHYIQTDASINRGNSGGPLFNINGQVVGVNTAIMSPTGGSIGIGFAVPSEIVVPVIEQLRQFGEVRRGWIGVRIQDVTDEVAAGLGMGHAAGAFVAGVTDGGPAAKAGVAEGDVVVEFNGKAVDSMRALPRLVADTPPGDTVDMTVIRDGKRVSLKIETGLLEDEKQVASTEPDAGGDQATPAPEDAAAMLGLSLSALTDEERAQLDIGADIEGVLVAEVAGGSEAEDKSVQAGDVILQVDEKDVSTPDDVIKELDDLKAKGRRTVTLLLSGADKATRRVSLRFEDQSQP